VLLRTLPLLAVLALLGGDRAVQESASDGLPPIAVLDLGAVEKDLPAHWQLEKNEGKVDVLGEDAAPREGRSWVRIEGKDEERRLRLYCQDASFSVNRDLSDEEIEPYDVLEWEWNATVLPELADMRVSKRNDQALQVLVQLDTKAKKVISYVWDTSAPVGTQESESYAMGLYKVKVLCVQSGSEGLGEWHKLRRDLRADYKALFGSDDFPGVAGIRIQSNSQYTHTSACGAVRSLVLRQATPAPAPGN
jgi:Protein of unknown function (DUF3047)